MTLMRGYNGTDLVFTAYMVRSADYQQQLGVDHGWHGECLVCDHPIGAWVRFEEYFLDRYTDTKMCLQCCLYLVTKVIIALE